MSEQSKAPRWMKVALVIQAIVICLGLGFYRLSIRPIREVQLPTHSEQQAFVKIPDDALSPAVPDVPGQLSVPHASLPSLSSSMPLTLGSDGSVSLGSKDKPLAALSTPGHTDPANITPSLPNPDPTNPQLQ